MGIRAKRLKYTSSAVTLTILVIASTILFNVIMGILTNRFTLRYDMTPQNLYKLSDKTKNSLNDLHKQITINVLMDEASFSTARPYSQIYEVLLRYKAAAGNKLSVKYIDLFKNPNFVNKYRGAANLNEGSLIVESDLRYRVVPISDLFVTSTDYNTGNSTITGLDAEQALTSAINFAASPEIPTAVFVAGHNETTETGLNMIFKNQNYKISEINLRTDNIPKDTSLVVISTPKADYDATELSKLDSYLKDSGDMLVVYGPECPVLPELEAFFSDWGVKFEQNIVFDPTLSSTANPLEVFPKLTDHQMNNNLNDNVNMRVMTPALRSISILWSKKNNTSVSPILTTSESAYVKNYSATGSITSYDKGNGDITGVENVAVLAETSQYVGNKAFNGRILFIGSSYAANKDIISSASLLNSDFLSNSINFLSEQSNQTYIPSKSYYSEQLVIIGSAVHIIFWLLVVILPAGIVFCGFYQWWQRRHM